MDFGTACSVLGGCSTDFLALRKLHFTIATGNGHLLTMRYLDWYGINATQFIGYMEEMHNIFQLNIWVTEFACHEFVSQGVLKPTW